MLLGANREDRRDHHRAGLHKQTGQRDPAMSPTEKGGDWYFDRPAPLRSMPISRQQILPISKKIPAAHFGQTQPCVFSGSLELIRRPPRQPTV